MIIPLTPLDPLFEVCNNNEPLLASPAPLATEEPLTRDMLPPYPLVDVPEENTKLPAVPELPAPTLIYMEPPRPDVDAPVPMNREPLFPKRLVPVLKIKLPLKE